jgi:diguanylate cyclase (GGDEF)-like protein
MKRSISEAARHERLAKLRVVDASPDPGFNRIAEIARRTFDVPIAAVSFVDSDRLWFKARCGLDLAEIPREGAICDHTIRSDSVLVVEDAAEDSRFMASPLVARPPYVRFYAGAPLTIEEGLRIGALCLMSDTPRGLPQRDRRLLRLLADETCQHIHRNGLQARLAEELERGQSHSRTLLELSQELARKDRVSRQVYRMARIGGWEIDLATNTVRWSDEIYDLLDVNRDVPLALDVVAQLVLEEDREPLLDLIRAAAETGKSFETEVPVRTKSAGVRWFRLLGERDAGRRGQARLFGTLQDVTARRRTEYELKRFATTDGLTGLPNRTTFMASADATLKGHDASGPAALLLLDLDGFKEINDMLGHDAGDRLLVVIARRLQSCLRHGDIVGRLGGDEFGALLCGGRSLLDIATIARLMLEAVTAPVSYLGHSMHVGASVGISLFPQDAPSARELMKRADAALYGVKRTGGDGFKFYDKGLGDDAQRRLTLLREVRAGLAAGEIVVAYQPVVELREGALAGMEALVRWNHPTRGLLPASAFLAALEEPNLGRALSDAARDIAIEQFGAWCREGLSLGRLGLNLSAAQLRDVEFSERLFDLIAAHGLEPSRIVVEITEGILLGRGSENVARRIGALHDAGICIALDDFGTGYASLTHLRQFPVDLLKIDKSFVRSMISADDSRTIVKTVIDMAHGLGMRAVAEGVEGPEIDAILRLMGCDLGQGYYYARPMLAENVPPLLRDLDLAQAARSSRTG